MAIEDIIRALEEQADAECREIVDAASEQASAILADARGEADKIVAEKSAHADSAGQARASQLLNAARLDNKRSLASARERGIGEVYDTAAGELAKLRGDRSYPALFRSLLAEALSGVEGDAVVQVDPADKALAESTLAELEVKASVDTSTSMTGGVTVATRGMRVFRRNTLEDRMARARKIGQSQVAEILFG
jgi:V/A-type H+/Na+-transporting ATPase subunit E